ncbi:probable protein ABIL1 [Gossypium raimondii]|nr:probable protein ABIL1 [Gossypium raimondii]XP_052491234.1 probable protein ABIL1 [Gossypium raimondii]XP_052491235.1 probable protein ABIL1 [Gossypium raimondii]XP_052491236.1 probable protein ABIL1 [Gossypium raimondii]XP_052491237.1 probable protein ABIL1 [Gossypium raimondii]XP_052491238.1 probable protein ABIL1 [Gossypium raimondii]
MDRKTGYWWSLDGKFIAFTEVDYSEIPLFRIMHQVAVLRHTTQPVSKGMRHSLNPRQNGTATYTDKEGIRQQQLLVFIPRHHKHYILPNSVSKKVHFSPQLQTDRRQNYLHAKSCLQPSGLLRTSKMLMVRQLALLNSRII